jgi:hypothetical protein
VRIGIALGHLGLPLCARIVKKRLPMWQAEATVGQQFPSHE